MKTSLKTKLPKQKAVVIESEEDSEASSGLYVATPPQVPLVDPPPPAPAALYPALAESSEPLAAVLNDLSSAVLRKLAEKSLAEAGAKTVGDLARMTAPQASKVKGLMPPNNVATILEALKKFEARSRKSGHRASNAAAAAATTAAAAEKVVSPVLDVSTPEEEEKTMKDLYERPSPQPDESEQEKDKRHAETMTAAVTTEAVGIMTNLDKKDIADAEAQCDARETAHAQVQSTSEASSSGAQTEWTASTVLGVFMENAQLLSASELLSAISKATATLQSKMDTTN